jgi:hypothetical protein
LFGIHTIVPGCSRGIRTLFRENENHSFFLLCLCLAVLTGSTVLGPSITVPHVTAVGPDDTLYIAASATDTAGASELWLLAYTLPYAAPVRLEVRSLTGAIVETVVDDIKPASRHRATFSPRDLLSARPVERHIFFHALFPRGRDRPQAGSDPLMEARSC